MSDDGCRDISIQVGSTSDRCIKVEDHRDCALRECSVPGARVGIRKVSETYITRESITAVPDVRMVAKTEETLLVGKHDPLSDGRVVLGSEWVRLLPLDKLLPQLHLIQE